MAKVTGDSPSDDGVLGVSSALGKAGVAGVNETGGGADGGGNGVFGRGSGNGVFGISIGTNGAGVVGTCEKNDGVRGVSASPEHSGVVGSNTGGGFGVLGQVTGANAAVAGVSSGAGNGVFGSSTDGEGIRGVSHAGGHGGVVGINDNPSDAAGPGVFGESTKGEGVRGISHSSVHGGVVGTCDSEAAGVFGESAKGEGVRGISHSADHAAVVGTNDNAGGIGIFGKGGRLAGRFEGDVEVTGDIRLTTGQDFAEDFDISAVEEIEPGTVMVLNQDGELERSKTAYDRKVAGVISGAGDFKPGITLGKRESVNKRLPVALMGKVFCMVDAEHSPIEIGDLLTTSPTPGHAMKVGDPLKAFGSVIGKALRPLKTGQGLIPILIALQ